MVDNDASDWALDAEPYIPDDILMHTDETTVTTPMDAGHSQENADHVYGRYVDAVLADDAPFYQISKEMFIVSGWDVREECNYVRPSSCRSRVSDRCCQKNTWYHLQSTRIGADLIVVCVCPHEMGRQCVHERFLTEYREEKFPDDETFDSDGASNVLSSSIFPLVDVDVGRDDFPLVYSHLFSRQPHDADNTFTNLFSIPSPNQRSLQSRVFVTHIGQDSGAGVWRCSKDLTTNCPHIITARHLLQKLILADPTARDSSIVNAPLDYTGKCSLVVIPSCRT